MERSNRFDRRNTGEIEDRAYLRARLGYTRCGDEDHPSFERKDTVSCSLCNSTLTHLITYFISLSDQEAFIQIISAR